MSGRPQDGLLVDRAVARAMITAGKVGRNWKRTRSLLRDTKRRLENRPDEVLVWQTLPHIVETLVSSDPARLAGLLERAGVGGHHSDTPMALHATAMDAIRARDPRLLAAALDFLRSRPSNWRFVPSDVRDIDQMRRLAAEEVPGQPDTVHEQLAELALSRPGIDGIGSIVALVGPRGSGKSAAAAWLAVRWHRARAVDASSTWSIGLANLLSYGAAYRTLTQSSRRVLVAEGGDFRAHGQYIQPSDAENLVRELSRPSAPVLVLALRTPAQLQAFLDLHADLPSLLGATIVLEEPDLECIAADVVVGLDITVDQATSALRLLRRLPGWSGARTGRRLRTAVLDARSSTDPLAVAMRRLAPPADTTDLQALLQELHDMVGLDEFKAAVLAQLDAISEDRQREADGLPRLSALGHHAFIGPPGTGKTTVARLYARILHAAGALPRADVTEVTRADLVAEYIGQTAVRTEGAVDRALGGVLFIDEAYALDGHDEVDFGREAIATLVAEMENRRGDLVVIFAGYEEETIRMIELNAGLRSRISFVSRFPAMTAAQQTDVFLALCRTKQLAVGRGTATAVMDALRADRTGGNARAARTLFERAVQARAARRAVALPFSDLHSAAVEPSDIPVAGDAQGSR